MKDPNLKTFPLLHLTLVFLLVIFVADIFVAAYTRRFLRDFSALVVEANRDSSAAKLNHTKMQEELEKNRSQIESISRLNTGLQRQLEAAEEAIKAKEADIAGLRSELANVKNSDASALNAGK